MPAKPNDLVGKRFGKLTVLKMVRGEKGILWYCMCDCGNECLVNGSRMKSGKTSSCGCLKNAAEDLSGKTFGRLTALHPDKLNSDKWYFKCECGNVKSINKSNVKSGKVVSCGCYHREKVKESLSIDLAGRTFGRLKVIETAENIVSGKNRTYTTWKCKCECGNYITVKTACLTTGGTRSCGCLKRETTSEMLSLKLTGKVFGRLTVLKRNGTFVGIDNTKYSVWTCKCSCGTIKDIRGHDLVRGKVVSCGCIASKGEEEVRTILNKMDVKFITQHKFDDLKSDKNYPLRFDFALTKNDKIVALIEYQGIQHFVEQPQGFGKQQREVTDIQKRQYCIEKSIPLLEIRYDENSEEKIINFIKKINY